ncbi:Alpha/Beta hydrolase protein [Mucidula mucida]|nr:Alpha/Beta hydrolase protein [Mucidula mucida]
MPSVKVKTSAGKVNFFYTISTPTSPNAKAIDKNLPTILFLHAVYFAQESFQLQFGDPQIRRFNCVAVDLRGHGYTTGDDIPAHYSGKEAGEEIAKIIEALKLPACHIVAQCLGTIAALGLAMARPKLVASLFLISPLGLEELPDIAEGRREIFECWQEGFKSNPPDESALQDAVYGALQFSYSNNMASLAHALLARTYPLALKNWGPKNFDNYNRATILIFNERKALTQAELAKIGCPVKLIQCGNDVAYPMEYMERFHKNMKEAALNVSLSSIPGASHFGCVTNAGEINVLMHDFVLKACKVDVPPAPLSVTSPWESDLLKAGWEPDTDSDEE